MWCWPGRWMICAQQGCPVSSWTSVWRPLETPVLRVWRRRRFDIGEEILKVLPKRTFFFYLYLIIVTLHLLKSHLSWMSAKPVSVSFSKSNFHTSCTILTFVSWILICWSSFKKPTPTATALQITHWHCGCLFVSLVCFCIVIFLGRDVCIQKQDSTTGIKLGLLDLRQKWATWQSVNRGKQIQKVSREAGKKSLQHYDTIDSLTEDWCWWAGTYTE